jgi:hypothetical protein
MHENVRATLLLDESKTLLRIKPLNFSCCHTRYSLTFLVCVLLRKNRSEYFEAAAHSLRLRVHI